MTAALDEYRHVGDHRSLTERGLFVAEGRLVVRRLLALPEWRVRSVLVTPAARAALAGALDRLAAPLLVVDPSEMREVAGFNFHRGCLALAERPPARMFDGAALAGVSRVVVLEGVNNPDNVGGIFRSAAAFGVELVVVGPGCADPLYRKAVRTSIGATLAVPFVHGAPWPDALAAIAGGGMSVMALTPDPRATPLSSVPPRSERTALLVGAEGEGLSEAALGLATRRVRIPMPGGVDSLNVTTAASIAMYHWFGTR